MMNYKELAVIVPIYNEEKAIAAVFEKWHAKLSELQIDFEIHAYNDGSTDGTTEILDEITTRYPRIIIHHKRNCGHGPTILQGYRENSNAQWLFQIDSDDEMEETSFDKLWLKRFDYDFLIGIRKGRQSPIPRQVISLVSKLVVHIFYHPGVLDVNSPYRLLRSDQFRDLFFKIPATTFAPNVIISGFAALKRLRIFQVPVTYHPRTSGKVSIQKLKLLRAAVQSFVQTICFRFKLPFRSFFSHHHLPGKRPLS
jgi:glycosyltransferase involved in cell wall biosynthesis